MIILDERKDYFKSICENCKNLADDRRIEELDWITRKTRDSPFICFNCHGPRIHWKKRTEHSKIIISPCEIS